MTTNLVEVERILPEIKKLFNQMTNQMTRVLQVRIIPVGHKDYGIEVVVTEIPQTYPVEINDIKIKVSDSIPINNDERTILETLGDEGMTSLDLRKALLRQGFGGSETKFFAAIWSLIRKDIVQFEDRGHNRFFTIK